jgi:hypothetical protein
MPCGFGVLTNVPSAAPILGRSCPCSEARKDETVADRRFVAFLRHRDQPPDLLTLLAPITPGWHGGSDMRPREPGRASLVEAFVGA